MAGAAGVPRVILRPPPDWVAADVERPPISEGTGAELLAWDAWRRAVDADGGPALAAGCVATPIPGWVEDMRPAVEARSVAFAGAVAAKITGGPVDARGDLDGTLVLRAAARLEGAPVGRGRAFVGFDDARVFTCFAVCASSGPVADCEASVVGARIDGSLAPPAPGAALRAGTWAIHHPREVAWGGGAAVVVASCLAVVFRRRPRSRSRVR